MIFRFLEIFSFLFLIKPTGSLGLNYLESFRVLELRFFFYFFFVQSIYVSMASGNSLFQSKLNSKFIEQFLLDIDLMVLEKMKIKRLLQYCIVIWPFIYQLGLDLFDTNLSHSLPKKDLSVYCLSQSNRKK